MADEAGNFIGQEQKKETGTQAVSSLSAVPSAEASPAGTAAEQAAGLPASNEAALAKPEGTSALPDVEIAQERRARFAPAKEHPTASEIDAIDAKSLVFEPFGEEDVRNLRHYFYMRPNRTCDSAPLDSYLWRNYYKVRRCIVNDECVLMMMEDADITAASMPLCPEEKLPAYFKLQERYFNEVLHMPYQIFLADEEGVAKLGKGDALSGYDVEEEVDLKDYLYDGETMRTLSGRKLSKKRNHIHKFEEAYAGRWNYRALNKDDKLEILALLTSWKLQKDEVGEGEGVNDNQEHFDAMQSLDAEILGVHDVLNSDAVFANVKIGGVFIDGALKAFSIGNYNPAEKMAVIDIEKADPDIIGLYQVINQQFLIHEFPDAELVNREDDVGLPGLRHSKLSYYPIDYARKYIVKQQNFHLSDGKLEKSASRKARRTV